MGSGVGGCTTLIDSGFDTKPSPAETNSDGRTTQDEVSGSSLRLGNRTLVASTLTNAFGTSSAVTSVIRDKILNQHAEFGGAENIFEGSSPLCDDGSPYCTPNAKVLARSKAPTFAYGTAAREAFRIGACYEILKPDDSGLELPLRVAINKAKGLPSDTNLNLVQIQQPTPLELSRAFHLFYFEEDFPDDLATALLSFVSEVNQRSGAKESWRWLFLTLCADPAWQAL